MGTDPYLNSWIRIFDAIASGGVHRQPYVHLGRTPPFFRKFGLAPFDLVIVPGKIARAIREHPEVGSDVWHRLPGLLRSPVAILPSQRRDGSIITVLAVQDSAGDPVFVPITAAPDRAANLVLSVYGKQSGATWLAREIAQAKSDGLNVFVERSFAASLPQPGSVSEDTIPSSPGPIPADGTAKPKREILHLRKKST